MKVNVAKSIEVDVALTKEEWETLYNAFNILDEINSKVTDSGLDDDSCFSITTYGYTSPKSFETDNESLSELLARYDEFLA